MPKRRLLFLGLAGVGLISGLFTGLFRMGWQWAAGAAPAAVGHGPLMVCGFLGTLISLERAVALGRQWTFLAPLLTGLGGLVIVVQPASAVGPLLITLGSLVLLVIFSVVLRMQNAFFVQVMALGAGAWLVGNVLWLGGISLPGIVAWWMGFLVLTIAGERLELSRMLMPPRSATTQFVAVTVLAVSGLIVSVFAPPSGWRLWGGGLVLLAAWLGRYDVARRTIRGQGLPRFIAACLLLGYVWLAAGGLLALTYGYTGAGPAYDAILHAVFVGFVFSMIFGHAPIIFPAILGLPIRYRPSAYVPLALLHASLALRLVGDVAGHAALRRWGGLLNALSIVLYLGLTAYVLITSRRPCRPPPHQTPPVHPPSTGSAATGRLTPKGTLRAWKPPSKSVSLYRKLFELSCQRQRDAPRRSA